MSMTETQLVRLSKWVSLRLRHDPADIGLTPDAARRVPLIATA